MPLDRQNITVASRVMLPTYAAFFTAVGLNYLLTPLDRLLNSPGLAYCHALVSLRVWGVVFLGAAVVMSAALIRHHRTAFRFALILCGLSMSLFAVALVFAYFRGEATPTGWVYPAFIIAACVASYRSLTVGEV